MFILNLQISKFLSELLEPSLTYNNISATGSFVLSQDITIAIVKMSGALRPQHSFIFGSYLWEYFSLKLFALGWMLISTAQAYSNAIDFFNAT
jgi:hypothetical protein